MLGIHTRVLSATHLKTWPSMEAASRSNTSASYVHSWMIGATGSKLLRGAADAQGLQGLQGAQG
jgi:hypothetical protein